MTGGRDVDHSLLVRVSALSRGSQRWLKTAIQAIKSSDVGPGSEREEPRPSAERRPSPVKKPGASLEDVITGKADLREQLDAYPELSTELEGLADVIDLLREAGERRRKRGEEILRELLEGDNQQPDDEGVAEDADLEEEDDGRESPPRRPRR